MIIGISGKKQCGKDTICKIIQAIDIHDSVDTSDPLNVSVKNLYNDDYIRLYSRWNKHSFADKLKEMASILTGNDITLWEKGEYKNQLNALFGVTNREILQGLGNGAREQICPDVWVKALFSAYKTITIPEYGYTEMGERLPVNMATIEPYWIIPDVRMPNEAQAIKERGGILIRVNRKTKSFDTHISEVALDDYEGFDYIIDNNGTIEELIDKVIEIYNKITKQYEF